jgi:tungstate transport system substrate-binding protein
MKRFVVCSLVLLALALVGFVLFCPCFQKASPASEGMPTIILATTTSARDTGLLDTLLPIFDKKTDIRVKVIAVGSGQAMRMGRDGEADVLLVHAREEEEKFLREGHGIERRDVMSNEFLLVGPAEDNLKIQKEAPDNIIRAFQIIAAGKTKFISRGDESGTHQKEKAVWQKAGVTPAGEFYVAAGRGMGEVLMMAEELKGYTLTDRGTYLFMRDKLSLVPVTQKDSLLLNPYGVILVNPQKNPRMHPKEARLFMEWLVSPEIQKLIGKFGVEKWGEPLFIPAGK